MTMTSQQRADRRARDPIYAEKCRQAVRRHRQNKAASARASRLVALTARLGRAPTADEEMFALMFGLWPATPAIDAGAPPDADDA